MHFFRVYKYVSTSTLYPVTVSLGSCLAINGRWTFHTAAASIAARQHDCKYVSTVPEREEERKREGNTTAVGYLKGNYSTPTADRGLITTQNYHLLWAPAYLKAPCHWLRVAFSFYLSQHPDISWLVMNTEVFFPFFPKLLINVLALKNHSDNSGVNQTAV